MGLVRPLSTTSLTPRCFPRAKERSGALPALPAQGGCVQRARSSPCCLGTVYHGRSTVSWCSLGRGTSRPRTVWAGETCQSPSSPPSWPLWGPCLGILSDSVPRPSGWAGLVSERCSPGRLGVPAPTRLGRDIGGLFLRLPPAPGPTGQVAEGWGGCLRERRRWFGWGMEGSGVDMGGTAGLFAGLGSGRWTQSSRTQACLHLCPLTVTF